MSPAVSSRARLASSALLASADGLLLRVAPTDRLLKRYYRRCLVRVATRRITHGLGSAHSSDLEQTFVLSKDPLEVGRPLQVHHFVEEHFVHGVPVEATSQYRLMMQIVEGKSSGFAWGCRSPEDVRRYFDRLQAAYRSIADHGYKSQRELGAVGDELVAWVGPDGRLVKGRNATHRMSMAQVLGVSHVPVVIAGVHRRWLERHGELGRLRSTVADALHHLGSEEA